MDETGGNGSAGLLVDSPYVRRAARPSPRSRLVCFPFAGAGASVYRDWPELLPSEVEVLAIQPPGREDRVTERPFTQLEALVRALAQVLRPYLGLPTGFFGHSSGALVAFETARRIAARGAPPPHLFVAGQAAPQLPLRLPEIHDLPEPEFREAIRDIDGTAPEVFADEGLMSVLVPTLRADFTLWEGYRYRPGPPLPSPITVFGGESDDRSTLDDLEAWRAQTTGAFRLELFPGAHFFFVQAVEAVTGAIAAELAGSRAGAR